jgi:hypothetical protein
METTFNALEERIRELVRIHGMPKYYIDGYNPTFPNYGDLYDLNYLLRKHLKSFIGEPLHFYWHEPDSNIPSPEMELDGAARGVPVETQLFTVKIHFKDGTYEAYSAVFSDDEHI